MASSSSNADSSSGNPMPTMQEIIDLLQIPEETILNVYPYGSHLYGLATPTSDWDMIVIVKEHVGPLVRTATHPGAILPGFEEGMVSSPRIDITVYHESYWRQLLHDNVVRILLCSAIPKSMVLKEDLPFKFEVNFQRLKTNFYLYLKMRERISQQFWRSKQIWESKKQLLHVLRVLEVSHQIVDTGKIVDYTTANRFWPMCREAQMESYEQLQNWFKERYLPLYDSLKAKLNVYKDAFERICQLQVNKIPILDYLQFHARNDFVQLERETSVKATTITYPTTRQEYESCASQVQESQDTASSAFSSNLVILERQWDSPRHSAIQQCYRAVVERSDAREDPNGDKADWKVVALAPRKYWEQQGDRYVTDPTEKFVDRLEYSSTRVYEKPQGIGVLLFWHQNSLRAVFGTSGFYSAGFALRHRIPQNQIGKVVCHMFWQAFDTKQFRDPPRDLNWTFHFTFHPDEKHLILDAIMDNEALVDISMRSASSMLPGETSTEPLMEIFASRHNWNHMTRVPFQFPSKNPKNDNALGKNFEAMTKLAMAARLSLLAFEGFVLIDAAGNRVQTSLPQYTSLQLLMSFYERRYRTRHVLKIVRATIGIQADEKACLLDGPSRFCLYFPQWKSWYTYISSVLRRICDQMDASYKPLASIASQDDFKTSAEAISLTHAKIFWKLRSTGQNALTYFADPYNLNEGPGTQILQSWVEDMHVFDDVQSDSTN